MEEFENLRVGLSHSAHEKESLSVELVVMELSDQIFVSPTLKSWRKGSAQTLQSLLFNKIKNPSGLSRNGFTFMVEFLSD